MKAEHEKMQQEEKLMQELRDELYKEQLEEKARKREQDQLDKLMNQKEMMRQAELEDRKLKEWRRQNEALEEERFKNIMLKKFAEDDAKEKLYNEERRQREIDHRKEVSSLLKSGREIMARETGLVPTGKGRRLEAARKVQPRQPLERRHHPEGERAVVEGTLALH